MKILFVCKYNRFRSRVAEAYFKKVNKNKNIMAESAGIIEGSYPLASEQVKIAKKFGIDIEGRPRALSSKLLREQDLVVIVADDVPESIFKSIESSMGGGIKTLVLKIKDAKDNDPKAVEVRIKLIMEAIDDLIKQIEVKNG